MKARALMVRFEGQWVPKFYPPSQQTQRVATAFLQEKGRYDVYFSESGHNRQESLSMVRLETAVAAMRGWVERGVLTTKGRA